MKTKILRPLLNRILTSLVVLYLLVTFVFILIRLAPGDPSQKYLSPQFSPELAKQVYQSFDLDKPIYIQYYSFLTQIFTGDFGISYNYRQPVLLVITNYFLFTLLLALLSFLLQLTLGYWFAKIAFNRHGKLLDKVLSKLSIFVYSIPSFVIGLILIYIFSVKLNLLPTSGIESIYQEDASALAKLKNYLIHILLPLITLSMAGGAVFFKYLRDNLIVISNSPFITNLRASGYSEKEIFKKHLFPNALQPLISIAGIEFGMLLGGALITEVIFSLPGMGRLTINAILNRDFPLVIGCTFIAGFMMILANLAADLIKIKMDKRLIKELIK